MIPRNSSALQFLESLGDLLDATDITEIAVNEPGEVWIERNSRWSCLPRPEIGNEFLRSLGTAVATYTHQVWNERYPLLSASLPTGARIQLVMPPAVHDSNISMTLRKPSTIVPSLAELAGSGLFARTRALNEGPGQWDEELSRLLAAREYESFFRLAVMARKNIVVSGATGSGKTTFMKALVKEIPLSERLITIEDVRELFVPHRNRVHLLYSKGGQSGAAVTPKALLESCLRMKPDRILLAELRGDECLYYVRNAASGHPGSITSCHAGSTELAFEQLAIMIQDSPAGTALSFDVIKHLLRLTIDIVVQFHCSDGERFISHVHFGAQQA